MLAVCTLRTDAHYRREKFIAGLRAAGYDVAEAGNPASKKDLLVIWNRYHRYEQQADQWEAQGGTVLVAENGYLNHADGRKYYALAIHGHNGSGWYPMFDDDRFSKLGIELQPWVERDGIDLICGQRGIGSRTMASPANWHTKVVAKIPQPNNFHIRQHPGNLPAKTTVEQDLEHAKRCIIWSSSSGVKALVMGIPVRYDAPYWICAAGATRIEQADDCKDDEVRFYALNRMANAQFSVDELESGEPFARFRDACEVAVW